MAAEARAFGRIVLLDPPVDGERLVGGARPAQRVAQRQIRVEQGGALTGPERQLDSLLVMVDRVRLERHQPVGDAGRAGPVLGPLVALRATAAAPPPRAAGRRRAAAGRPARGGGRDSRDRRRSGPRAPPARRAAGTGVRVDERQPCRWPRAAGSSMKSRSRSASGSSGVREIDFGRRRGEVEVLGGVEQALHRLGVRRPPAGPSTRAGHPRSPTSSGVASSSSPGTDPTARSSRSASTDLLQPGRRAPSRLRLQECSVAARVGGAR